MPVTLRQRGTRRTEQQQQQQQPHQLSRRKLAAVRDAGSDGDAIEGAPDVHGSPEDCARRLEVLMDKCFGDLQFLLDEFSKLEIFVAPEPEVDISETDSRLGRLRFFTTHVRRTMTRIQDARSGLDPLSMPQLALLEDHIATSITPVKARLLRQLNGGTLALTLRAGQSGRNHGSSSSGGGGSSGGSSSKSSDEASTSRSSSISSGMEDLGECPSDDFEDGLAGEGYVVSGGGDAGEVGMELDDDIFGVSLDDASPGVLDVIQHSRTLRSGGGGDGSVAGRLAQHRRDQLDLLSQLEAEGVFAADDAYSPCRIGVGGTLLPLIVPVGMAYEREEPALSEISRVSAIVGFERGGGATHTGSPWTAVKQEKEAVEDHFVKQELCDDTPATSAAGAALPALFSSPFMVPRQASTASGPPMAGQAASSSTAGHPQQANGPASVAFLRPKCEQASACVATSAAGSSSGGCVAQGFPGATGGLPQAVAARAGASAPAPVVYPAGAVGAKSQVAHAPPADAVAHSIKQSSSLEAVAREARATGIVIGAASIVPKPLSGVMGRRGTLLMPPRPAKRRKPSLFPAALLQPREVRYLCGACGDNYTATVTGNPWWLLVRQECPTCRKMQIPRVDILNPTNNVEGHIAFLTEACAENGSDGDGSCMDWEGDTSDDNSGDEDSGDERDRQGSLAGGLGGGDAEGGEGGSRNGSCGPTLDSEQAAKLLVLMCHARTCPGNHQSPRLAEVCRSVKFLMLHLRDCDGRTRTGQPCPMPWCQPCTSLLHHLIQCPESAVCQVCNPLHLPSPLRDLRDLNHAGSAQQRARHATALQQHAVTEPAPTPFGQHAPDYAAL